MSEYTVDSILHQGVAHTLVRARGAGERSLVLKRLEADRRTPSTESRLRHEHAVLSALEGDGIVRALALEEDGGALVLVLEDVGGVSLAKVLRERRPTPAEVVALGVRLVRALVRVHEQGVIHKDINPQNIIVDAEDRPFLIDFGLASRVRREYVELRPTLEGTLAYLAPEQSGRINRPVDARADLYALGATLYEMSCGRPPFVGDDPMELVHAHIAREPPVPAELNPDVPEPLSRLILKLLAKEPDARYQSAAGLEADLVRIAAAIDGGSEPGDLTLGTDDIPADYRPPNRVYGRARELAALRDAHARVAQGGAELVLIRGDAGIGKSSVVHELRASLRGSVRFVSGKFEALGRNQPYLALRQALDDLARELLTLPEDRLVELRASIRALVGERLPLLLELVPTLAAVFGEDAAAAAALNADAARARMRRAVAGLLQAVAHPRTPLLLFLDDLQWGDSASLELLGSILAGGDVAGMLLVGSYRDDEVRAGHPLLAAISTATRAGCPVTELDVGPLRPEDVEALLEDTLVGAVAGDTTALAELVHARTEGNPFFVGELLRALHVHSLIVHDRATRSWSWEIESIRGAALGDNIISLMAARVGAVPAGIRRLLEVAACVGNRFDAGLLEEASGQDIEEIEDGLRQAAEVGLVVRIGDGYRFFHDRVRHAVYEAIDEAERRRHHHGLGRMLLARGAAGDERIFEVMEHLGAAGAEATEGAEERRRIAEVSLAAARRARETAAFDAGARYSMLGLEHLGDGGWEEDRALAFGLHRIAAETAVISAEYETAERLFGVLHQRAESATERADIFDLEVALLIQRDRLTESIAVARKGLASLGIDLPRRPGPGSILSEFLRARWAIGRRTPDELIDLPALEDEEIRAVMRLMATLSTAAFQIDMPLMMVLAMRMMRISLRHGISPRYAAQLITYGLMVGAIARDHRLMDEYGLLALRVLERYPDREVEGIVRFLYAALIQGWCHPLRETLVHLEISHEYSVETGQLVIAATALAGRATQMWAGGFALDQVQEVAVRALVFGREAKLGASVEAGWFALSQTVAKLTGEEPDVEDFEASDREASPETKRLREVIGIVLGLEYALIFGDLAEARRLAGMADDADRVLAFSPVLALYHAYSALALTVSAPERRLSWRERRRVRRSIDRLGRWTEQCPENFAHLHALLLADLARARGDGARAVRGYEVALETAEAGGFLQHEALTAELAARFYEAAGAPAIARLRLAQARRRYARWGAKVKVEALDAAHPELESASPAGTTTSTPFATTTSTVSVRSTEVLDASSLVKATQAFASEYELDRLLERIMHVVVENAGAQRGVLLLDRGSGLGAVCSFDVADERYQPLDDVAVGCCELVLAPLVNLAHRSGEPVVIEDLGLDARHAEDEFVRRRKPRSTLVIPLRRGSERLGAVYLENDLVAAAFTPERVETTRLLGIQAAISVEHALYFARLERARRDAEVANLAKNRFLANMSHELRTPLNGILGYVHILRDDAADQGLEPFIEGLDEIERCGERLTGIIGDILELTKVESDLVDAVPERIELRSFIEGLTDRFEVSLGAQGNRLQLELSDDLGAIVSDRRRLRQVLVAITDNAIRFTKDGIVALAGRRVGTGVEIEVRDSGIGISQDMLEYVQQPFTQVDASNTRARDGAGLGLTIARVLCDRLGGSLKLDSELGVGTTVTIRLPLELSASTLEGTEGEVSPRPSASPES